MLPPALRVKEPTFREGIANYVAAKCRPYHIPCVDVDDIKQDALFHIIANVGTFRPEKSEFEQWARGIAWNVIREYVRRAKLYFALFTEYHPSVHDYAAQEPSPERCARRNQARCALTNAAENLKPREVEVLNLHVFEDMTHKDIGYELKISESASQKCYQRALDHLARCIEGDAFSVMPPSLTSCDEPASFNESYSQRFEKSHYRWQGATTILAVLLAFLRISSTTTHETTTGEARILAPVQNDAMYRSDELTKVNDEPSVLHDAPGVKPEPASLRSVPNESTPAKVVDKPADVWQAAPLPPYNDDPASADHHLFGDDCP